MDVIANQFTDLIASYGIEILLLAVFCTMLVFQNPLLAKSISASLGFSSKESAQQHMDPIPCKRLKANPPRVQRPKKNKVEPSYSSLSDVRAKVKRCYELSAARDAEGCMKYYYSLRDKPLRMDRHIERACAMLKVSCMDFYVSVVQSVLRLSRVHEVFEIVQHMKENEIARPVQFYESVMRLLAASRYHKEALQIYDLMREDGLQPPPVTRCCLVKFAVEANDYKQARKFFTELCEHAIPSVRCCMSMVQVYAKEKDVKSACDVLKLMKERNLEIDPLMLNSVLAVAVDNQRLSHAEELLIQFGRIADVVSYNTLFKGYARSKLGVDGVFRAFELMQRNNIAPDIISFNTALHAMVRSERLTEAINILNTMEARNVPPDQYTVSTFLKGLNTTLDTHYLERAVDLCNQCARKGNKWHMHYLCIIHTQLCDGLCQAGLLDHAYNTLRTLATMNAGGPPFKHAHKFAQLHVSVLNLMIRENRNLSEIEQLYNHLRENVYTPPHSALRPFEELLPSASYNSMDKMSPPLRRQSSPRSVPQRARTFC